MPQRSSCHNRSAVWFVGAAEKKNINNWKWNRFIWTWVGDNAGIWHERIWLILVLSPSMIFESDRLFLKLKHRRMLVANATPKWWVKQVIQYQFKVRLRINTVSALKTIEPACKLIAHVPTDRLHFNLHERNWVFNFFRLFGVKCLRRKTCVNSLLRNVFSLKQTTPRRNCIYLQFSQKAFNTAVQRLGLHFKAVKLHKYRLIGGIANHLRIVSISMFVYFDSKQFPCSGLGNTNR